MRQQTGDMITLPWKSDVSRQQAETFCLLLQRRSFAYILSSDDAKQARFALARQSEAVKETIESFATLQAADRRHKHAIGRRRPNEKHCRLGIELGEINYVWHNCNFSNIDSLGCQVVFRAMRVCNQPMS